MSTDREKVDDLLNNWSILLTKKRDRHDELHDKMNDLEIEIEQMTELYNSLSDAFTTPELHIFTSQENKDADKFVAESFQDELESLDS